MKFDINYIRNCIKRKSDDLYKLRIARLASAKSNTVVDGVLPMSHIAIEKEYNAGRLAIDINTLDYIFKARQEKAFVVINILYAPESLASKLMELGFEKLTICADTCWANEDIIIQLSGAHIFAYAISEPTLLDEFVIKMQELGYKLKQSKN